MRMWWEDEERRGLSSFLFFLWWEKKEREEDHFSLSVLSWENREREEDLISNPWKCCKIGHFLFFSVYFHLLFWLKRRWHFWKECGRMRESWGCSLFFFFWEGKEKEEGWLRQKLFLQIGKKMFCMDNCFCRLFLFHCRDKIFLSRFKKSIEINQNEDLGE